VGPKKSSWSPTMLSSGVLLLQRPPQMLAWRAQDV
jgi:hypothetical protein